MKALDTNALVRFLVRDVIPMGVFGLLIFTFSVVKFQKRVK